MKVQKYKKEKISLQTPSYATPSIDPALLPWQPLDPNQDVQIFDSHTSRESQVWMGLPTANASELIHSAPSRDDRTPYKHKILIPQSKLRESSNNRASYCHEHIQLPRESNTLQQTLILYTHTNKS